MTRISPLILLAMGLSACSLTLPVQGRVQNTDETFTGSATGNMNGDGVLTIRSSRGTGCKGDFVYVTARTGEGVFACDDGRSGPFRFVSSGSRGNGRGTLGGQEFTFTFGG
jgi:hypothetical protein